MDGTTSGQGDTQQGRQESGGPTTQIQPGQTTQGTEQRPEQGVQGASQGTEQDRSRSISRAINSWLRGGGQSTTAGGEGESRSSEEPSETERQQGAQGAGAATDKGDRQATRPRSILEGDPNEQVTLTRAEIARAVQSAKDAQIASENRRNADLAAQRATAAQMQTLRELADPTTGDPEKLMEAVNAFLNSTESQNAQAARTNEIITHVRDVGLRYDAELVKPLMDMLPEDVSRRIEREAPEDLVGLPHRAHLFRAALDELIKLKTSDAERTARESLRSNEAFKKQVLNELRGGLPSPELVPATAPSSNGRDINTWLRKELLG